MAEATVEATAARAAPAPGSDARWFRGDVDGLRAVAIALVLLFHAEVPLFGGGFTGVDVFFVISGYLITRRLLDEGTAADGRIAVVRFWCRRIRRLVPALTLVVLVTLVGSFLVLPSTRWPLVAKSGGAAGLYVSNLFFGREAGDYFGSVVSESPFLHTWSLGVEEQFYVLWPLLVGGVGIVAGTALHRRVRLLVTTFAVAGVASFGLSLWQTNRGSTAAFYGPWSRVWEFALAGILAVVARDGLRLGAAARTALAVAGLAAIGAAGLFADPAAFPGFWAVLPVLGTAAVIVVGEPSPDGGSVTTGPGNPVTAMLAFPILQWVGRVSYSWYLWHWPAIVLLRSATSLGDVKAGVLACVLSLPVAAIAHRYVENPIRYSPTLRRSPTRTLALGGLATAVVVVAAAILGMAPATGGTDLTSQINDAEVNGRNPPCEPAALTPSGIEHCALGATEASRTVMLIGDSHARHWAAALGRAAEALDLRLVLRYRGRCPAPAVRIDENDTLAAECTTFQADTLRLVDELRPVAVIVSNAYGYTGSIRPDPDRPDDKDGARIWTRAQEALIATLQGKGVRLGVITDNPMFGRSPVDCLAKTTDRSSCDRDLRELEERSAEVFEADRKVLAAHKDIPVLSGREIVCPAGRCHATVGETLVYVDAGHLSVQFTMLHLPELEAFLREVVR